MTMQLTSSAFAPLGKIPRRHTCEGEDVAPPLSWTGVPAATRSLVLIVDDPDAPDPAAPTHTWVHWIVIDIAPDTDSLPQGGRPLPAGARSGLNDWHRLGYGGPCPPVGRHRYFFKLYALDTWLTALIRPTKSIVEHAMNGHVLAQAELVGTYQKSRA
ncbi:MAG: YbhB/YbcL family Raf kinase inhibitor-like protein [Burkholderiaceae bacterium]|nr:YbhB/YbcL family Raf kinase inhibitor-like protein [Burkholderiaceae bacterium]